MSRPAALMNPPAAFHAFGPSHGAALLVIGVIAAGLIAAARRDRDGPVVIWCERALAVSLLAFPFGKLIVQSISGDFDLQSALPLHYCDLAALAGAAALITHRQWLCEITYFFGLSGTLQGLITPALQLDFPHPRYWLFFGQHGVVVIAALYVVLGLRKGPQAGGVRRAMLTMTLYAAVVGFANFVLGTNYGFLCAKPPTASLMDFLGPWPWYVGALWLVGLVFYSVLDLPFAWKRRRG